MHDGGPMDPIPLLKVESYSDIGVPTETILTLHWLGLKLVIVIPGTWEFMSTALKDVDFSDAKVTDVRQLIVSEHRDYRNLSDEQHEHFREEVRAAFLVEGRNWLTRATMRLQDSGIIADEGLFGLVADTHEKLIAVNKRVHEAIAAYRPEALRREIQIRQDELDRLTAEQEEGAVVEQ